MKILHRTDDLMGRVRLDSRWQSAGAEVVKKEDGEAPGMIVLDLQVKDAMATLKHLRESYPEAELVVYGPHVEGEALKEAKAAGADLVVARGKVAEKVLARLGG
ncbi:MAG TPA: DNA-binding response regulator [Gammaproteobacteria bacterium]|nr:DNA-binding response regulator [Gammaproteobacteria bacterium]